MCLTKMNQVKLLLSSDCEFQMDYYLNNPYTNKRKLVSFKDYVYAIKDSVEKSYEGKLDLINIEVKNNKVVKISEVYMP